MSYKRIAFIFSLTLLCGTGAFAEVRLPAVISDNMVLQHSRTMFIWGWAEPGENVSIEVSWQMFGISLTAGEDGRWMTKLRTPKAGGPFEMTVTGSNRITVKNILAGEVWVCSGQSNMQWPVKRSANAEQEVAAADYPDIWLFTVERKAAEQPQSDCVGNWTLCSPQTISDFSAVAYFFGRELHKELNVPVGLIHTSWGGTPAEAWTSRDTLESDPEFELILKRYADAVSRYPQAKKEYEQKLKEWEKASAEAEAEGSKPPQKPHPPMEPINPNWPSMLYNAMIAPLIPYDFQGAIWYQGESNVSRAYQYRKLFPAMIQNWRTDWIQRDFPFYYVQIAPLKSHQGVFSYEPLTAAELREAQLMTLSVPNTGMVVTMDIGNVNDIHPRNKQDVGGRLALWALAKTYNRDGIVYSGPICKSMRVEDNKTRLFFDHVGGGLAAKGGELALFTIAGDDKKFIEAKAVIDGDTIVVSSNKVKNPAAVRYAWSNAATPNLFNKEGLPASPFRTDDWPGITINKK